ncbi:MAG: peptidoglycan DD-metalloendopeptidase family protein [Nitrospirae bacterium]|nr:peptidoglycan DD-metalloendopeptidase family protein [Nitrospirota bacterium]
MKIVSNQQSDTPPNPPLGKGGQGGVNPKLQTLNSNDPKAIAKQMETVFLNEFLKVMMEQTSFGKDRTVSTYMPYITSEISKSLAERGIGFGDFFLRSPLSGNQNSKPELNVFPKADKHSLHFDGKLNIPADSRITSGYGLRHDPIDGKLRHHNGIDIAMPEGTPVASAASGRVVFSGFSSGYGNCVIVEHENGLTSLYAHNSVNLVKTGDVVDKNKTIALSGSTGRSTGPHLHFEVRKGGVPVDPANMIG